MTFFKKQSTKFKRVLGVVAVVTIASSTLLVTSSTSASAFESEYNTAGSQTNLTIPAGVTSVFFVVQGGTGEDGAGDCGGRGGVGAVMAGTIEVEAGDVLGLYVGRNGDDSPENGGQGGSSGGGNGGDASYILINTSLPTEASVMVGAGGGGGAGNGDAGNCNNVDAGQGGDAGQDEGTGQDGGAAGQGEGGIEGGEGANGIEPGDGALAVWESQMDGGDGLGGLGGNGGDEKEVPSATPAGGGGGGAGFAGGGGGAGGDYSGSGGGAGSSNYDFDIVDLEGYGPTEGGDPSIYILYDEPEVTTTTTAPVTTTPNSVDADLDGIGTLEEHGAPNSGDANDDKILDENQNNVASLPGVSGKYVTVVSPEGTQLSSVFNAVESGQSVQDATYDYKYGLTFFTVSGVTPGSTITMSLYFENIDAANSFVARKLLGSTYSTLDGASIINTVVGTSPAVKLTYSIADNGPLDSNSTPGVITDPVGLGSVPGALPTTGTNSIEIVSIALTILLSGAAAFGLTLRRRKILTNSK